MYYNDSDQARESGLRRAFVESMQELMKCVNTLAAGAAAAGSPAKRAM